MAYLYRHIRLDKNEVFYVGIGSDENYDAKKYHLIFKRAYYKCARNKHWTSIILKTPYDVEIIMEGLTWDEACDKEKEFIKLYGRRDLKEGTLCNLTDGGEGQFGYIHTEETKRKISLDNKRPEKLAVCLRNLEKANTPEAKKKRYENIDYSFLSTPEFISKRVSNTDYKAIAAKINYKLNQPKRLANIDYKSRQIKIAAKLKIPVVQYSKNEIPIKEWASGKDAATALDIDYSSLNKCCNYKRPSAGGFIWIFKD